MSGLYKEFLAPDDQKEWSERISKRLNCIYQQLCEYEEFLNEQKNVEPVKLMDILENVEELQGSTVSIRLHDNLLKRKQLDLEEQMNLLQQSVDLLNLDNNF